MTPFSIWLKSTGYWGVVSGLLCCAALTLFAVYRPESRDWVNHGSQSVAGIELTLETRLSDDDALDVRLSSASALPISGKAGFSVATDVLVIDRQFVRRFVPPASPEAGQFVFETASGRFAWRLGRVLSMKASPPRPRDPQYSSRSAP
ncbi:MAG: hypothetical protein AAFY29_12525 [Pseudomonadota bacterium]